MNHTPLHQLCLAGIVALSLVLPLIAATRAPGRASGPKPWRRILWAGQGVGALGGLLLIFSPMHPAFGLGIAVAGCVCFGGLLARHLRLTANPNPPRPDR